MRLEVGALKLKATPSDASEANPRAIARRTLGAAKRQLASM